jgi:DNA-directed RNA polymerase subunit N (RpoN/RPB10)
MEAIRCSCNNTIAAKYYIFTYLKDELKIEINKIFEILNITKDCCKLKFLTVARHIDYV